MQQVRGWMCGVVASVIVLGFSARAHAQACDADALTKAGKGYYAKAQWGAALASFSDSYQCKTDQDVAALAALAACKAGKETEAKAFFPKSKPALRANIVQTCMAATTPIALEAANCDFDALSDKGRNAYGKNQWDGALAAYEEAYACKPDTNIAALAALAACHVGNAEKARAWYPKASKSMQANVAQTCTTASPAIEIKTCDFDALGDAGKQAYGKNQWKQALKQYSAAYSCKADEQVAALATLAACHAGNAKQAKVFYPKSSASMRENIAAVCTGGKKPIKLD